MASTEIQKKQKAEVELVQAKVYETALESFASKHQMFEGMEPSLLFAEAEIAQDKPKEKRTGREKTLVHFLSTVIAVDNAVQEGLVTNPQDAEQLTDALVFAGVRPSTAIKYLKHNSASKLDRALNPRELATVLSVHDDIAYTDEGATIATIARVADAVGVSLDTIEGVISDVDMDLILGSIDAYKEVGVDLEVVEDDLRDGPVAGRKRIKVSGTTLAGRSEAGVNALDEGDKYTGSTRVAAFAEEIAGIDDPDEVEDLYHPHEEK